MTPRRALVAWDLDQLTAAHVAVLRALETDHDQLIIVVTHAAEAFTVAHPRSAGERIAAALPILRRELARPFHVLPVKRDGLSAAQYATRLRLQAPRFATVVCHEAAEAELFARVLGVATRIVPDPAAAEAPRSTDEPTPIRRGLFITRAQPFHLGHLAFVRQILRERDEVIVLLAMAQASHTVENFATAGERIEIIHPLLEAEAHGRYHLAAAPYLAEDGANVPELALLLPRFDAVYANSPSVRALAESAGYAVVALDRRVDVSGREIRRRIIAGEEYRHLLPPEIARALDDSPSLLRLRALGVPESR